MTGAQRSTGLTARARAGFTDLAAAGDGVAALAVATGLSEDDIVAQASRAADPDAALAALLSIARRDSAAVRAALRDATGAYNVWLLLGASRGFAEFYLRHPRHLSDLAQTFDALPTASEVTRRLHDAVGARDGLFAADGSERAWVSLRVEYRRVLAGIAVYDLSRDDPVEVLDAVAASLADAAGAALDAALCVARTRASHEGPLGLFPRSDIAATRLAVVGMGKCGARELNYVSDVDVIFVCADAGPDTPARAVDIATRLAVQTIRAISGMEVEPPLWDVDANLRPEGRQGALVRTLSSHIAYYDRWAHSWEFQALMKARAVAGDAELGAAYVDAAQQRVWGSAARENFVDSVQRMRERVTDNIPADDLPYEMKLGPGGLRDIEFTVQLLQLVHGLGDAGIRQAGTLEAIDALMAGGYVGRDDAAVFARDYRILRVLEHRVQLHDLQRTHLMPALPADLRVLSRMCGAAVSDDAWSTWERVRQEVRDIHVRLFYKPLLTAVAQLPDEDRALASGRAHDRLAAIGFTDPVGALRHIAALTAGVSRKAIVQRNLMPVMIHWFAEGADPDYGLLAFRRISDRLGDTPWFLRMLRDSAGAANRLTHLLSASRLAGDLMEWTPESVAWLDDDTFMQPREEAALRVQADAVRARHTDMATAAEAVRALRRRELLRTAMATVLGLISTREQAAALTAITDVTLQALLEIARDSVTGARARSLRFGVIAMGRFGGAELGFGSDADVLFVYDPGDIDAVQARQTCMQVVGTLRTLCEDARAPLALDADLRPEGRNGPLVRSVDAYREYYRRWSVSWEAQALLRARPVAGDADLLSSFMGVADDARYPAHASVAQMREIRRIKARVEAERLPRGIAPARHLKLGPGGLSDVEWLVQSLQLQHAAVVPALRTTSTLDALAAAEAAGLVAVSAATRLREAWMLASRLRSAVVLASGRISDVLPTDRRALDAVGRLIGLPPRSATAVEESWTRASRRARRAFEREFYG